MIFPKNIHCAACGGDMFGQETNAVQTGELRGKWDKVIETPPFGGVYRHKEPFDCIDAMCRILLNTQALQLDLERARIQHESAFGFDRTSRVPPPPPPKTRRGWGFLRRST